MQALNVVFYKSHAIYVLYLFFFPWSRSTKLLENALCLHTSTPYERFVSPQESLAWFLNVKLYSKLSRGPKGVIFGDIRKVWCFYRRGQDFLRVGIVTQTNRLAKRESSGSDNSEATSGISDLGKIFQITGWPLKRLRMRWTYYSNYIFCLAVKMED